MKITIFLSTIFMINCFNYVNARSKNKPRQLNGQTSQIEVNLLDDIANFLRQCQDKDEQHPISNDMFSQHKQEAIQGIQQSQIQHQTNQIQNQIPLAQNMNLLNQHPSMMQIQQQQQMKSQVQNQYQMNNQDYIKHLQLQGLNNSQQQIINHNKFQQLLPEFQFNGQTITPIQKNSDGLHEIRIPIQLPKPEIKIQPQEDTEKIHQLELENQDNIGKINELQQQILTLEDQLQQKQSQIDALEKETKEQINLEHKEEKLVEAKTQENEQINQELDNLKKEKQDLQDEYQQKQDQLLDEVDNLKKQNVEEMTKINEVQKELNQETSLNEQIENEQKQKELQNEQVVQENQNFIQEVQDLTKQVEELQLQISNQEQASNQLNQETQDQMKQAMQSQYQQKINRLEDIQKKQISNITEALDAFNSLSPSDNQNVQRTRQFIEKINDYIKDSQGQIDEHKQKLTQIQDDVELDNSDLETPIENIVDHEKIQNLIAEIQNSHVDESQVDESQNKETIDNEQLNNLDHVIDELQNQLKNIDDRKKARKLFLQQSRQYVPQPRKIIQNFRNPRLNRKLPLRRTQKRAQSVHHKRVLVRLVKKIYDKNHNLIKKIPIKKYYKNYI